MNNYDIYKYVFERLGNEDFGDPINIEQFERDLNIYSIEYMRESTRLFEEGKEVSTSLAPFKVSEESQATTAAGILLYSTLSETYYRLTGVYYNDGTSDITIDEITDLEYHNRLGDALTKPTASHPVLMLDETSIIFKPSAAFNAETVFVSYLKKPSEPIFDYCYDADDNLLYMEVGWTINGSNELRDASNNLIASGVTHPDSPALPYTSTSVELEWTDNDKIVIANKILQANGVELKDQVPVQYAQQQEIKDSVK